VRADQLDGPDDELGRTLELARAPGLEEVGVEEDAQHRAHVAVGVDVGPHERLDRLGVLGRHLVPGRHLGLVGAEEVVELARDEAGRGRLADDDVDDILAVEAAGLAEEGLDAVVVVVGAVDELDREEAVRVERDRLSKGPAGEGARGLLDVGLGVVADSHGEQLEQLAPVVLVRLALVVLVVVEPEDHGRVAGELEQNRAHVRQPDPAEHRDLGDHRRHVLGLVPGGREHVVPAEGDLLLERAPAVDHAVQPAAGGDVDALAVPVAPQDVLVDSGRGLGVQQLLDDRLVASGCVLLELGAGHAEPGATHQVSDQDKVVLGHALLLASGFPATILSSWCHGGWQV
jgi:hypothetical protein